MIHVAVGAEGSWRPRSAPPDRGCLPALICRPTAGRVADIDTPPMAPGSAATHPVGARARRRSALYHRALDILWMFIPSRASRASSSISTRYGPKSTPSPRRTTSRPTRAPSSLRPTPPRRSRNSYAAGSAAESYSSRTSSRAPTDTRLATSPSCAMTTLQPSSASRVQISRLRPWSATSTYCCREARLL